MMYDDGYNIAKYGLIDKTGREILPPIYDRIGNYMGIVFNYGIAIVRKDGKVGAIDTTGDFVIPMIFTDINDFSNGIAVATKDGKECIIESPIKYAFSTASKVIVDGKEISFSAYNIEGNNYFKIS